MSYTCLKCDSLLSPETTGLYPFWDGYICGECHDKVGEEFCKAVDEFEAHVDPTVDPIMDLLHLL